MKTIKGQNITQIWIADRYNNGCIELKDDKENYYKMNIQEFNKIINDLTFTKEKKRVHTHLTIKQTTN